MAASSAPGSIAQYADAVDVSVQKYFIKSSDPEVQYPKFFNVRTTEDYFDKDSSLTGLGEADFVDENATIISDVPASGFKQTYTQTLFAIILSFTYKMWRFGIKRRDVENVVDELKRSIARKQEKLCAERLDNFASANYTHSGQGGNRVITITGGDGLAAGTSSHTREDGGTNMNNGVYDGTTYNLPFDYAGLKAAWRAASLFVDGRGNPRPAMLDTIIVKKGSAPHFKAMEILGAIKNGKIPESFDNDGTGVPAYKVIALDYLTNANYWHMFDSSRALTDREGFQFVMSQPATLDPVNVVYKTKEIQVSATAMWDLGHNDVTRSWVFSKGDSTSLS